MVLRFKKISLDALFIHNGGWPAGRLCRWMTFIALLARVPSRNFIVHNFPWKKYSVLKSIFLSWSWVWAWVVDKCATSIVTVSDSVKAELEKVFRQPVLRIHNGIDLSSEDCSDSSPLPWCPSGSVVGFWFSPGWLHRPDQPTTKVLRAQRIKLHSTARRLRHGL